MNRFDVLLAAFGMAYFGFFLLLYRAIMEIHKHGNYLYLCTWAMGMAVIAVLSYQAYRARKRIFKSDDEE